MNPTVTDLGPAWLFCPANRPDRFAKAAARADVVILDLEDGVAAVDRPAARAALSTTPLDPTKTIVRLNPVGSAEFLDDLAALRQTRYRLVMLAKTESADDVGQLAGFDVIALCETPLGILHAREIAAAETVCAVMWGAEDLVAAIGGFSSRHDQGAYRDVARHARASTLLAGAAAGTAAVDAVYLDIPDLDGLAVEATDGAAQGFAFKACIHPSQVDVVRAAYRPSSERLAWANGVLAAADSGPGVFTFEGRMVDEPVLRQARRVVRQAAR